MAGGTEQWLSPRFNSDMPRPSMNQTLMYALAAPVKGLPINSRNGSAFLSAGTELRMAFSALRSAIPVGSDFWRSLRIYGFADAATVWNRGQFLKNDTSLFPTQITQGPIRVELAQNLSPFLWSYGMGTRANVLGYSLRIDRAWPWENRKALPPSWVISLGLDF
jgi:outer membrane protein assembly factor BamA